MNIQSMSLAFINGLISSMSACVYPLIPITTAIFGAGKTGHWLEGLSLSGIYVSGMAVTYVALGLIAALTGSVFGSYMGSPIVIFIFAMMFFILALGFLDIIPLPLPNFGDALQAKKTGKYVYPLVLGIFSGFIAAPCTAPLYGAILLDIAKNASANKSLLPGITQALFFSFGMGLPFLLIGGFALKLPKPGKWLKVVKYIGATVLITAGLHYLEDLIGPYPPEGSKTNLAILGGILGIIFFVLSEPLTDNEDLNIRQKAAVVLFLFISAFGLFLVTSLFKHGEALNHEMHIAGTKSWQSNLKTALQTTGHKNPVLIDFRADWCTACNKMEEELFPSTEFQSLIEKYRLTLVRLDYTEIDSEEKEAVIRKYNIPGFPTLLIVNSNGIEKDRIIGYRSNSDTTEKLKDILNKHNNPVITEGGI